MSKPEEVRKAIRARYADVAQTGSSCCGSGATCCSGSGTATGSTLLGYSPEMLSEVPEGADLGLGCGNPQAIAALQTGETVLDLGSGAGLDCFLAARAVGPQGRVIGVDMTPEMVARARTNAEKARLANVEFRLGEIEHLPVADESIDVIISNCVINLSPDKPQVFREAFRVLRPGGRLAISDIVASGPLPEKWRERPDLLSGCIAGASTVEELEAALQGAGFEDIHIRPREESREFIRTWEPEAALDHYIVSADIQAKKPSRTPSAGI